MIGKILEKILHYRKGIGLLAVMAASLALYFVTLKHHQEEGARKPAAQPSAELAHVNLTDTQLQAVKVQAVEAHDFDARSDAVGTIGFNDERTVPIFPTAQGRILQIFTDLGRDVRQGDALYSIDSPDLLQAESTLIAAAATRELTTHALERARALEAVQGIAQKDLQQAVSDQQAADASFKAARDSVRIYGKTDADIDRMVSQRRVDSSLLVRSPINGRVVARNAAPGMLVQPGTAPAPIAIADLSVLWMLAQVSESDLPTLKSGQKVQVKVLAFPGRTFQGTVTNIGASVDSVTHRTVVRSDIRDPAHELRPGMLANFSITTGVSHGLPAVPLDSVVREGDGTLTVWATQDKHRFFRRPVTIGLQQDGLYQILSGIQPGDQVATEGAIFISHAYEMESR